MTAALLMFSGGYLTMGLLFAIAFVCLGAGRIDPHARGGSWGFRFLILPGAAALWPLLLSRWVRGVQEPPEQHDPHRRAALQGPAKPAHYQSTSV